MGKKLTILEFIEKAKSLHGIKYDYSLVEYVNYNTKIKIICSIHGIFEQTPNNHLSGKGCAMCYREKQTSNTDNFIIQANKIHKNKYDYSLVNYKNSMSKVIILCSIHGKFEQTPNAHLNGQNCSKCTGNYSYNNADFINQAKLVHGNKYDYSLVNYEDSRKHIKIICPIHGEFEQTPSGHLMSKNCYKCYKADRSFSIEEFIERAKNTHGDKYNYSLTKYTNMRNKVKIICPLHGEFLQTASEHVKSSGCPNCKESKGEKIIKKFLIKNKIDFIPQYKFDKCRNKNVLSFDFYLPKYNTCIEYNGIQHYKFSTFLHKTQEAFENQIKNDEIKMKYCETNNIDLIIIKYDDNITYKLDTIIKKEL